MPDRATVSKYEDALSDLGDFQLSWIAIPGFSRVFRREAAGMLKNGRYMPGIVSKYGKGYDYQTLSVIGYSAGCWMWRDGPFRSSADRKIIDAAVMLDGAHATNVDEVSAYANYAKANQLILLHTDVQTYGYADTTKSATSISSAAPGRVTVVHRVPRANETQKQQHGRALTETGPELVRSDLVPILAELYTPPSTPPWKDKSKPYYERCIEFSMAELSKGNLETRGHNDGPRIEWYFEPATRAVSGVEKRLGLRRGDWCVSGACRAATEALLPMQDMPHPYRVSGIEIERDAKSQGTWVPASRDYHPQRGDLRISKRGTQGWQRHVCRVLEVGTAICLTIGANEGTSWRITERKMDDQALLGWVSYPREKNQHTWPLGWKNHMLESKDGMDEVDELIKQLGDELTG